MSNAHLDPRSNTAKHRRNYVASWDDHVANLTKLLGESSIPTSEWNLLLQPFHNAIRSNADKLVEDGVFAEDEALAAVKAAMALPPSDCTECGGVNDAKYNAEIDAENAAVLLAEDIMAKHEWDEFEDYAHGATLRERLEYLYNVLRGLTWDGQPTKPISYL